MRAALRALLREALRSGTLAGVAMVPFAAIFRARGLRINEYGQKTLALVVGEVPEPAHTLLSFVQHLMISWVVAIPLLLWLARLSRRRDRVAIGLLYGAGFYGVMNSLALPFAFHDPTPWQLGPAVVLPSLFVHLVYGLVMGLAARPVAIPIAARLRRPLALALGLLALGVGFFAAILLASESGEVVTLTTFDAAGRPRETRLWLVDHDGAEFVRSGHPEKGWFVRLRTHPRVLLARGAAASPRTATVVTEPGLAAAVNAEFARKYGAADWIVALSGSAARRVPVRLDPGEALPGGAPEPQGGSH